MPCRQYYDSIYDCNTTSTDPNKGGGFILKAEEGKVLKQKPNSNIVKQDIITSFHIREGSADDPKVQFKLEMGEGNSQLPNDNS